MNFSAVILAGGKSSRMGCDKAFLKLGRRTLLEHQIDLARESGAQEVFISGRAGVDYSRFGCPVLADKFLDTGPLAGIERALKESRFPMVLVLAVDMPGLTAIFLRQLQSQGDDSMGVVPQVGETMQPLAAFYPGSAHFLVERALKEKSFAIKEFAADCVRSKLARFISLESNAGRLFENWNSKEDIGSGDSSFSEMVPTEGVEPTHPHGY